MRHECPVNPERHPCRSRAERNAFPGGDDDIGYFRTENGKPSGLRAEDDQENRSKYSVCDPDNNTFHTYNDLIMIRAVEAVREHWRAEDYDSVSHNCQPTSDIFSIYFYLDRCLQT